MTRHIGDIVLEVEDLHTYFFTRLGVVKAVDGVSFSLRQGETLGIVGESGCGKTMTALSLLRLVPKPGARIVQGRILLQGENLLDKSESEMRHDALQEAADFLEDRADGTFIGSLQSASWAIRKDLLHEDVPEADEYR